ncbi:hypothetical protein Cni_G10909 [Canna indica]|uniref:Acyl-coenzyme A thioesterase 13 n=1 Tax=Canna indica TaxID=4628 RepID=A0AAQ3QB52_9LILI|nr:hypothetical protein Cni_G10909 [Canna indica]
MEEEARKRSAEAARSWLENMSKKKPATDEAVWVGGFFDALCHSDLCISRIQDGRIICSFRVPAYLTDEDGNWQPGAIATIMDNVGAAAIMTMVGLIKVSVEFDISYFAPAKANEEVEIDARIVEHKGRKLSAVLVEVRKKGGGHLVAVGRQWMSSARPAGIETASKRINTASRL